MHDTGSLSAYYHASLNFVPQLLINTDHDTIKLAAGFWRYKFCIHSLDPILNPDQISATTAQIFIAKRSRQRNLCLIFFCNSENKNTQRKGIHNQFLPVVHMCSGKSCVCPLTFPKTGSAPLGMPAGRDDTGLSACAMFILSLNS